MKTVPVVILAGSDRRAIRLPASGSDKHPLAGYKGIDVRIGGKPLIAVVAERLRESGCFSNVYLAGPARIYREIDAPCELIDADATFARNIRTAMTAVTAKHPGSPVGFTVCDILPDVKTLGEVMEHYRRHAPCDMWFPMIRKPVDTERLGASSWKPAYRVVPEPGEPPVGVLPGHLAVVDPAALRLSFVYRLIQIGYRTRNRSIRYRRGVMVRGLSLALIYQDLLHVFGLRAPTLTWTVMTSGLKAARAIKRGTITREELEDAVRKIFVTNRHRKRYPERRTLLPMVEGLSLALDIDTEEEARAMGGDVSTAC
jgi:hypothetical protein